MLRKQPEPAAECSKAGWKRFLPQGIVASRHWVQLAMKSLQVGPRHCQLDLLLPVFVGLLFQSSCDLLLFLNDPLDVQEGLILLPLEWATANVVAFGVTVAALHCGAP
jgi:hypothetical protein